ncbi:hypothetical protein D0T84_19090 [Dysgonomonas sp. 521]|nr:hypothetical protein [Dysgonomonas sp. 521]
MEYAENPKKSRRTINNNVFYMKKYLNFGVLVMVMLALCINLSSCSDDDDDNGTDGNVVGKWSLVGRTLNGSSERVNASDFLEIKSDGSFLEYDAGDYAVGTWRQANGKLEINYDNEKTFELYPKQGWIIFLPVSYNIAKLTDKDMVLKATVLGFEGVQTYKRQ